MSGAVPAPCLPPLLGCWAISRWTEAGGFPREAQQEKGGGLGRKPLEPSWNPGLEGAWPEARGGEGWVGWGPSAQAGPGQGAGTPSQSGPCLGQASRRAPAGQGAGQARTPAVPGGLWGLLEEGACSGSSGSGSEFCLQWSWCHLLAGRGAASGTPTLPGAPQAIDLSSHSTLGGWDSGWPGFPQVHARADRSWLSPRRAQIPCQPGILSQLSRWPAVAEAAAAQGCQNHDTLASC